MDATVYPAQRTRGLRDTCSCRWWSAAREAPTNRVQVVGTERSARASDGPARQHPRSRLLARHIDFTNWFEWTQDLPGAFYLWIIEHLFVHNELARGMLVVDGRRVNLSAVDCPIFLLAGIKDHITPPEQVWALADLVATPAGHISRELVDAGHLGLFMGRAALSEHWTPIAERVRTYSL